MLIPHDLVSVRAPGTPYHELDLSEIPWLRHEVEAGPKGFTRYRRVFFLAGILAGAVLAWTFSHHIVLESRIAHLKGVIDEQLGSFGINISSMDLSFSMPQELVSLSNDLFTAPKKWTEQKDFSVGLRLRDKEHIAREHPVVLLPGIVSTALESWTTDSGNFRKKLWGGVSVIRTVATQKVSNASFY
jgi:phospholipid:diacylglycerol acyltransferase